MWALAYRFKVGALPARQDDVGEHKRRGDDEGDEDGKDDRAPVRDLACAGECAEGS